MLMLGFVITELLLVSGGLGAFYDQDILFSGSASMAVGVLLLAALLDWILVGFDFNRLDISWIGS